MRVVIAADSFKGSLSSLDVARHVEAGFSEVFPDWTYSKIAIADGGEGTVATLAGVSGGRIIEQTVTGPLGKSVAAFFGMSGDGRTAVIEMAAASGLVHLRPEEFDPMRTTTFGVGELMLAALDHGARHLIVGIGGSATNDGGAGMLSALGVRLLDQQGKEIGRGGAALGSLDRIDCSRLDPRLASCTIEVACDVDSPMVGPNGASSVFGPQKGATPEMVATLDANLAHYAERIKRELGRDIVDLPGGGAAGGLGAAMVAFLDAVLLPGAELIAKAVGLDERIAEADLVITGEGRMDGQTVRGKVPVRVAESARAHGKPVIAICGSLGPGADFVHARGVDAMVSVLSSCCTMEEAMAHAAENVRRAARNVALTIQVGRQLESERLKGAPHIAGTSATVEGPVALRRAEDRR